MQNLTDTQLEQALTAALRSLNIAEFQRLGDETDRRHTERERRLSAPGALTQAAQWYASQGIPVFPLRPRAKTPLLPAAHPAASPERLTCRGECGRHGHGLYDATTNIETVRNWWTTTPTANIGIPTGQRFDVIDIDGPPGYQSLADLRDANQVPPRLARAATPSGGMHLFIAPTGDGNTTAVLPGLDFRGRGGYVVAPPSIAGNGRRWDWIEPLTLEAAA